MLIDTEEPYKCCNEEWEFEQQQLLNSQGDCVRALCLKCGAYLEVLQGQVPCVTDLLNQCNQIVKRDSEGFTKKKDTFYSGFVESPKGEKFKVFIEMNGTGNYTILLPEEH